LATAIILSVCTMSLVPLLSYRSCGGVLYLTDVFPVCAYSC